MNKGTLILFIAIIFTLSACTDKDSGKTESLAKNIQTITYEVSLEIDADKPEWMSGLDRQKLVTGLFKKAESRELIPYDPFDLEAKRELSWEEIKENMGAGEEQAPIIDTNGDTITTVIPIEMQISEISSLIFIEEWNINELGAISKTVLGVAPVRHYYRDGDEASPENPPLKRIPFVCYFSDKKPPLFKI